MEPVSFAELIAKWKPGQAWASSVRPAYETLTSSSQLVDTLRAWRTLAMTFGDTHAPELCVVAARHARHLIPDGPVEPGIAKMGEGLLDHERLALLDLGLALPKAPGQPIPLAFLADLVSPQGSATEAWLATFLAPLDGRLDEAAGISLLLAAVRLGVVPPFEPFGLAELRATVRLSRPSPA